MYYLLDNGLVVHLVPTDGKVVAEPVLAVIAAIVLHKLALGLYSRGWTPSVVKLSGRGRRRFHEAFALRETE